MPTSNLEIELPTTGIFVRCIDSLIGVLGPDLQDVIKARELIMIMVGQFHKEPDSVIQMEALRSLEHLSMFAPGHVNMGEYVKRLQVDLASGNQELRDVAIDGLYQLMKSDAEKIFTLADTGLEERLWLTLNENPYHEGVRNIMRNWMSQTAISGAEKWIERCSGVMTKLVQRKAEEEKEAPKPTAPPVDLADDEVAGMAPVL